MSQALIQKFQNGEGSALIVSVTRGLQKVSFLNNFQIGCDRLCLAFRRRDQLCLDSGHRHCYLREGQAHCIWPDSGTDLLPHTSRPLPRLPVTREPNEQCWIRHQHWLAYSWWGSGRYVITFLDLPRYLSNSNSKIIGNLCSTQGTSLVYPSGMEWLIVDQTLGALTQIGDTASAYFTAAVSVHTFCTLALRSRLPPWLAYVAIIVGWVLILAAGTSTRAFLTSHPFLRIWICIY